MIATSSDPAANFLLFRHKYDAVKTLFLTKKKTLTFLFVDFIRFFFHFLNDTDILHWKTNRQIKCASSSFSFSCLCALRRRHRPSRISLRLEPSRREGFPKTSSWWKTSRVCGRTTSSVASTPRHGSIRELAPPKRTGTPSCPQAAHAINSRPPSSPRCSNPCRLPRRTAHYRPKRPALVQPGHPAPLGFPGLRFGHSVSTATHPFLRRRGQGFSTRLKISPQGSRRRSRMSSCLRTSMSARKLASKNRFFYHPLLTFFLLLFIL